MPPEFIPEYLEKWERPRKDFALHTNEELTENYVVYLQSRDSDLLVKCNWEAIIYKLDQHNESECDYCLENVSYTIHRFSHWAVGWLEEIHINEKHFALLRIADSIKETLSISAVLDEEQFVQREEEEFFSNLKDEVRYFLDQHHEEIDWNHPVYFDGYKQHLYAYPDNDEDNSYVIEIAIYNHLAEEGKTSGYFSENYPDEHEIENSLWHLKVFNNLNVLIEQAERIAGSRNHIVSDWVKTPTDFWRRNNTEELFDSSNLATKPDPLIGEDYKYADAYCMTCKRGIRIVLSPQANEVSISGEAIGLTCE